MQLQLSFIFYTILVIIGGFSLYRHFIAKKPSILVRISLAILGIVYFILNPTVVSDNPILFILIASASGILIGIDIGIVLGRKKQE